MKATEPLEINYASAIYGTILSMAVISASSRDPGISAWAVAAWAVATALVFFIAHVYSTVVAAGFARPTKAMGLVKRESRQQWPLVQGALGPAAVVLLAPLGVIPEDDASYYAVWAGVAMLFGAGLVIGKKENLGWGRSVIIASINAAIGLLIVGLKIFVH